MENHAAGKATWIPDSLGIEIENSEQDILLDEEVAASYFCAFCVPNLVL
jgi:hypothetical protein